MVLAVAAALVLAGCGGDDGDTATLQTEADGLDPVETEAADPEPDDDVEAADPETEDEAPEASGAATVAVASTDLGDVLVDGDGMTLYAFLPDEGGDPTCTEGCVDNWPLFSGPADAGDGVDASLLGTATHPDGTTMATYDGWPLYYFANDAAPGDTNGQGLGENWWVIGADGELIQ